MNELFALIAALTMPLCVECEHRFDDNDAKLICRTCEDWVVTDGE